MKPSNFLNDATIKGAILKPSNLNDATMMNNNLTLNQAGSISKWHAIFIYSLVSFFLFFEMGIQVSPSVMSSQLMQDLNIGSFGLGIMSGIYFYTYTAMQIPSGLLFDQYNPRWIITLSILICVLGTFLFASANNIYIGCIARLLMGCGSAFAFVSVLVVTADLFKPRQFATMTGITQMLAALGAMSGQMPISWLLSYIGWRNTLLILGMIGLVLAVVVWMSLKYKNHKKIYYHNNYTNIKTIIFNPQTWYIAIYACLLWTPMSSFASLWGVPFLINVHHLEANTAAFLCSLMWLGLAIASPILGIISTSLQNRVIPLIISSLIGTLAFILILEGEWSPPMLSFLLLIAGAACAGQALSFTVVKEINSDATKATAIAFNNMAVVISGAIFQPLIGKMIALGTSNHAINYNAAYFKQALLIILIAYVLSFLIAFLLIKEPVLKQRF